MVAWLSCYYILHAKPTCTTTYICCQDGKRRSHEERPVASKPREHTASRKLNDYCIARMTVKEYLRSEQMEVQYITTHTNHQLGIGECKYLPLPLSVKEEIQQHSAIGKTMEKNGW